MTGDLSRTFVEQLAPGLWKSADGGVHFNVPEILQHLGLPDTPADRIEATNILAELVKQDAPGVRVVKRLNG